MEYLRCGAYRVMRPRVDDYPCFCELSKPAERAVRRIAPQKGTVKRTAFRYLNAFRLLPVGREVC